MTGYAVLAVDRFMASAPAPGHRHHGDARLQDSTLRLALMFHLAHGFHRRAADALRPHSDLDAWCPAVLLEELNLHKPRPLAILTVRSGLIFHTSTIVHAAVATVRRVSTILAVRLFDHHFLSMVIAIRRAWRVRRRPAISSGLKTIHDLSSPRLADRRSHQVDAVRFGGKQDRRGARLSDASDGVGRSVSADRRTKAKRVKATKGTARALRPTFSTRRTAQSSRRRGVASSSRLLASVQWDASSAAGSEPFHHGQSGFSQGSAAPEHSPCGHGRSGCSSHCQP